MRHFGCLLAVGVALTGLPAAAQVAVPCDWAARADAIVEPWEEHTRTFANGDVRLALMDTVEPGSSPLHILLISPPLNELGERQCRIVRLTEELGYSAIDFKGMRAGYDPAVGLIFDFDTEYFNGEEYIPSSLRITLNQATGEVGVSSP